MRSILSKLYGFIISIRNFLYDTGLLKIYTTPGLVISVGNIEAGGTGKTPFTIALAKELKNRGYNPAIVTRGYKGRLKGIVRVNTLHSAREVGDEALLMARVSGVPVIKSPDRFTGAMYAIRQLGAQIILLDDGFQHRKLYRDFDIVLISRDVDKESLIPSGYLREQAASLKRAHIIISTKGLSKNHLKADLVARCLVDMQGNTYDLSMLQGKKIFAFCGIANPEHFFTSLKSFGAQIETARFIDHYTYCRKDLLSIREKAQDKDFIITTEKDFVKLTHELIDSKWLALRVEMQVNEMETIIGEIEKIVERRRIS